MINIYYVSKEITFGLNQYINDHFSFSFNIVSSSKSITNPIQPKFK